MTILDRISQLRLHTSKREAPDMNQDICFFCLIYTLAMHKRVLLLEQAKHEKYNFYLFGRICQKIKLLI